MRVAVDTAAVGATPTRRNRIQSTTRPCRAAREFLTRARPDQEAGRARSGVIYQRRQYGPDGPIHSADPEGLPRP